MALSVTSGSGGQSGEQSNPQASVGTSSVPALAGNVQPGTPKDQLTSSSGVSLSPAPLTTVNLSGGTGSASTAAVKPVQHHIAPSLFILPLLFLIVAAGFVISINRSSKKHNQYA